jgi:hypothetical protein
MGPRVALFGYPEAADLPPRRDPFSEHFDLRMSWVEWFNTATTGVTLWDPFLDAVIGHPQQSGLLDQLRSGKTIAPAEEGPYLGRSSRTLID